jgi:hypothetical protein
MRNILENQEKKIILIEKTTGEKIRFETNNLIEKDNKDKNQNTIINKKSNINSIEIHNFQENKNCMKILNKKTLREDYELSNEDKKNPNKIINDINLTQYQETILLKENNKYNYNNKNNKDEELKKTPFFNENKEINKKSEEKLEKIKNNNNNKINIYTNSNSNYNLDFNLKIKINEDNYKQIDKDIFENKDKDKDQEKYKNEFNNYNNNFINQKFISEKDLIIEANKKQININQTKESNQIKNILNYLKLEEIGEGTYGRVCKIF